MNAKKARAIRKMVQHVTRDQNLVQHHFKEMGSNFKMVDGKPVKITAPITVAQDTVRGQYRSFKRLLARAYR